MIKELYHDLNSIGILLDIKDPLSSRKKRWVDIEKTLVASLYEFDNDSKLMGFVFSWVKVHGRHVITDKFFKEYKEFVKTRGNCPWFGALCAFALSCGLHKFKKGVIKNSKNIYLKHASHEEIFALKGAIDYLENINIFIPNGYIRIREADILAASSLEKVHQQFRNRLLYGANWRADIVTAIEFGIENPYQIAKFLGRSYPSVRTVFIDYKIVNG